jgi:hypothetical protein
MWLQSQGVFARDHVDRASHERHPDQGAIVKRDIDRFRRELFEPTPQCNKWGQDVLCLQTDQMLDHLCRRHSRSGKQVLPRQQRPVQHPV